MKAWKTLDRRVIYRQDPFLTVELHRLLLPDGRRLDDWAWLVTPDFVNVAAVTEAGRFLLFRQTKYAVEGVALAPVGGYLEPDEQPRSAAERELLEETGYRAKAWQALGSYAVDGNRGNGTAHLFLALGAERVTPPDADDLEEQQLVELEGDEVDAALRRGEFKVLPWATTMALALQRWRELDAP